MTYEKARAEANLTVGEETYTHVLINATPPSAEWDVGNTQSGRAMNFPIYKRLQDLTFTFDVEGDFAELKNMKDEMTFSYSEVLDTPGAANETVDYEITGRQTSRPRAQFVSTANGFPSNTHNIRVTKFRETQNNVLLWDIDINVFPPKVE